MALHKKVVYARVYSPDGPFLKAWSDIDFRGYTKTLNGGVGECVLGLPFPFDYDGAELREGNDVEVLLRDADSIAGSDFGVRIIYKGYISTIERNVDGASETVTVHLLGHYTRMALNIAGSDTQTTLYSNSSTGYKTDIGSQDAADIGLMARKFFTQFNNSDFVDFFYYDPADVPDTGSTATLTFAQQTYREIIDTLKSVAPENVYWYIDETGRFKFKAVPTSPTHTFIFGRHVSLIHTEKSIEKTRNRLYLWNGGEIYKSYTDDATVPLYGARIERVNDYSIADEAAADAFGAKFLAENKDPSIKVVATIIDNNSEDGTNTISAEHVGPELISNGTFTGNADDWTLSYSPFVSWVYASNHIAFSDSGIGFAIQEGTVLTPAIYQLDFDVVVNSGGGAVQAILYLGTLPSTPFTTISDSITASGHYSGRIIVDDFDDISSGVIGFQASNIDCTIDNVSLREITLVPIIQRTGTDIENIQPGDTCRFVNFSPTLSDIFRDNMLITAVNYTLDGAEITVELVKSGLVDIQGKNTLKISNIQNGGLGIPDSYS